MVARLQISKEIMCKKYKIGVSIHPGSKICCKATVFGQYSIGIKTDI